MIISREYVTFKRLVEQNDPGGKLFIELLQETYPQERWNEAYNMLKDHCLYQREMEWGFRNIRKLIDGFKKLDQNTPYDNGYRSEDIWSAEVLHNSNGTITLLFTPAKCKQYEIIAVKRIKV